MRQKVLLGFLILVIGLGVFSIVYAVVHPEQNVFNYISGLATVVIAILTMAYVYVTSRQLEVMAGQLEQMEIERRLQNQPLPYMSDIVVRIEKPGFFFSTLDKDNPNNPYSAHTRYLAKVRLRNIGSHPAVCIDVSARIEVPDGAKERYFLATSINIATIGEKENYPIDGEVYDGFLFAGDWDGAVIEALRERNPDRLPIVSCRILFRNIMGGCFMSTCKYRLYPGKEEDDSLFVNWLSEMKSFWIRHKNDVENLGRLLGSDRDKYDIEYGKLEESFNKSVSGDDVKLVSWRIPGSFGIKSISLGEYEKEIGDIAYSLRTRGGDSFAFPQVIRSEGKSKV